MNAHLARFGINLVFGGSVAQTVEKAERAVGVGFDVVLVGDHLGQPGPLPTLVADSHPSDESYSKELAKEPCNASLALTAETRTL